MTKASGGRAEGRRGLRAMATLVLTAVAWCALCATAPASLYGVGLSHFGAKVDATTSASFCALLSGDTCQPGEPSEAPGGFAQEVSPWSVAVDDDSASPSYGNIYVVDRFNNRIQELTPSGQFVLMFGKGVNESTGGDICTQAEVEAGKRCRAGELGGEAGMLFRPESIAVDPTSGNVYVTEGIDSNDRVDEFTGDGHFVLTLGTEVNHKTGGDVCTQVEVEAGAQCQGSMEGRCKEARFTAKQCEFYFANVGNQLASGGSEDLLYVGSEHRVLELKADGTFVREIPLSGISSGESAVATGVALDQSNNDVYVAYSQSVINRAPAETIYKFAGGAGTPEGFHLKAREAGASINVEGLAVDQNGRLDVIEEELGSSSTRWFGSLVDGANGGLLATLELPPPNGESPNTVPGLSASSLEELYGASPYRHEAVGYQFREGAELTAKPATCREGAAQRGFVPLICSLNGEVNPSNVEGTEAWFRWSTGIGFNPAQETAKQPIATGNAPVAISATIEGLRPNSVYYYKLAAVDRNFTPPIPALASKALSLATPIVPPRIVGQPQTLFAKPTTVDMFGQVNPENTSTEYYFEYGTGEALAKCPGGVRKEACPGATATLAAISSAYGVAGLTREVSGLQPSTTYSFRLNALNRNDEAALGEGGESKLPEGQFTTQQQPEVESRGCRICPPVESSPPPSSAVLPTPGEAKLLPTPAIQWPKPVPAPCRRGFRNAHGHCVKVKGKHSTSSRSRRARHRRKARKG